MTSNINTSYATPENTSIAGLRALMSSTIKENMFSQNQIFFFVAKEGTPEGSEPDSLSSAEKVYENIVMLDRVTPDESSLVVPRVNWVSGTIYDGYDSTRNMYNYQVGFSGPTELEYKPYVMTDDYNVYLCIKNSETGFTRNKVGSTIKPTSIGTEPVTTADGYTWKYMYTVGDSNFQFLSQNWLPCPGPVDPNQVVTNKTSSKYRQQQNQIAAVGGAINDLRVDIPAGKNIYFDTPSPRTEVVGMGVSGAISLRTTFIADKGYKLTGYSIDDKGKDYIGGRLRVLDSPNTNGDFVTKTSVEDLLTVETSYGDVNSDLSSDPRITLQARTLMIIGNVSQTDESIGSFPTGVTLGAFGLISNPVYAEGTSLAGQIAGSELGYGTNIKLNIRQTPILKIRDDSGTGFVVATAKKITDTRLLPNSQVALADATKSTVMDLRPNAFAGSGVSNKADLYTTGSIRPFTTSDVITSATNATFGIDEITPATLKIGSGNILYINKNTFNILEEQVFNCKITLVQ